MGLGQKTYNDNVRAVFEKELTHNTNNIPACERRLGILKRGARNSVFGLIGNAGSTGAFACLMNWMSRTVVNGADYMYNVYFCVVAALLALSVFGGIKYAGKSVNRVHNANKMQKRLNHYIRKRDLAAQKIKEYQKIKGSSQR